MLFDDGKGENSPKMTFSGLSLMFGWSHLIVPRAHVAAISYQIQYLLFQSVFMYEQGDWIFKREQNFRSEHHSPGVHMWHGDHITSLHEGGVLCLPFLWRRKCIRCFCVYHNWLESELASPPVSPFVSTFWVCENTVQISPRKKTHNNSMPFQSAGSGHIELYFIPVIIPVEYNSTAPSLKRENSETAGYICFHYSVFRIKLSFTLYFICCSSS